MVRQVGGVEYDKAAHLQFGAAAQRSKLSRQDDGEVRPRKPATPRSRRKTPMARRRKMMRRARRWMRRN
jgi:hypothetical protein